MTYIVYMYREICRYTGRGKTQGKTQLIDAFLGILFFFFLIYLFIYWLCWVFVAVLGLSLVAALGLSLVAASGGYSSLRCADFSLRWLLLLQSTGSKRTGFSSCGTWAQ